MGKSILQTGRWAPVAVLDVQNLTLSFGERTLFAGVSFSIKEREKVGFVGANGVGKTSRLR